MTCNCEKDHSISYMAIKTSKYKKVLTKKLSSTVILLILLALGVFAVVFNRFYLNPRAMMIGEGAGGGNSSSNVLIKCTTSKICVRTYGANYECSGNRCVKKKVAPVKPSTASTFPICSYQNGRYLDPVSNQYVYVSPGLICTQPGKLIKYTKSQCEQLGGGQVAVELASGKDYYIFCLPTNCSNIGFLDDPRNSSFNTNGTLECESVSVGSANAQNKVDSSFKCGNNQDCVNKYGSGYGCNLTDIANNYDPQYGVSSLNRCFYIGE